MMKTKMFAFVFVLLYGGVAAAGQDSPPTETDSSMQTLQNAVGQSVNDPPAVQNLQYAVGQSVNEEEENEENPPAQNLQYDVGQSANQQRCKTFSCFGGCTRKLGGVLKCADYRNQSPRVCKRYRGYWCRAPRGVCIDHARFRRVCSVWKRRGKCNNRKIARWCCATCSRVDGRWSQWTSCSQSCGTTGTRTRSCSKPAPKNGGANCPGLNSESCNRVSCTVPSCKCHGDVNLNRKKGNWCWLTGDKKLTTCTTLDGVARTWSWSRCVSRSKGTELLKCELTDKQKCDRARCQSGCLVRVNCLNQMSGHWQETESLCKGKQGTWCGNAYRTNRINRAAADKKAREQKKCKAKNCSNGCLKRRCRKRPQFRYVSRYSCNRNGGIWCEASTEYLQYGVGQIVYGPQFDVGNEYYSMQGPQYDVGQYNERPQFDVGNVYYSMQDPQYDVGQYNEPTHYELENAVADQDFVEENPQDAVGDEYFNDPSYYELENAIGNQNYYQN